MARQNAIRRIHRETLLTVTNEYLQLVRHHQARKRFGQNFLIDYPLIIQLFQSIRAEPNDHLIEIGPGLGALTRPLLTVLNELTVIELDRNLIPILSELDKLNIIHQDVLTVDFRTLKTDERKLRIVGNLPYNISTPIIFHLLAVADVIQDMHFMLQKEVIDRMAATPDDSEYGRLSVMVQRYCQVIPLLTIPPTAFNPAPKVMSQFVRLVPYEKDPYGIESDECFYDVVKCAFTMKRKTLRNTLKPLFTQEEIEACGIDASLRAEKLSVADFATLSNLLFHKQSQS